MKFFLKQVFFVSMVFIRLLEAAEPAPATFDKDVWEKGNKKDLEFMYYKGAVDKRVYTFNEAGVLPIVVGISQRLDFLLCASSVENGKDPLIGDEIVYSNLVNSRAEESERARPESSLELAAHVQELGVLGAPFDFEGIKHLIEKNGQLLPNHGMMFGNYAVPAYLFLAQETLKLPEKLEEINAQQRKDRKTLALVSAATVMDAVKAQKGKIITKPLPVGGHLYKLSPYLAANLNFNLQQIEKWFETLSSDFA